MFQFANVDLHTFDFRKPLPHRGATRTIRNHPRTQTCASTTFRPAATIRNRAGTCTKFTKTIQNRPGTTPELPEPPRRNVPEFCRPCGGGRSLTMIFSDGFGIQFDVFYAAAMVVAPCL